MLAPFVEWLRENGLSDRIVINNLTTVFNVKENKARLGVGVGGMLTTQQEKVLDFFYSDPAFGGYIEV